MTSGCSSGSVERSANDRLVGGYHAGNAHASETLGAARFAVTAQAAAEQSELSLKSIINVETQVVAGLNYRMILSVRTKDRERRAVAVVWRKIGGEYKLTDWQWQNKGE